MVAFLHATALTGLLFELLRRQKEVHVKSQRLIELVEKLELDFSVVTSVAYVATDHRVVLLFYKTVVVFPVRPGASKGNLFSFTVALEMMIDKLTAIV